MGVPSSPICYPLLFLPHQAKMVLLNIVFQHVALCSMFGRGIDDGIIFARFVGGVGEKVGGWSALTVACRLVSPQLPGDRPEMGSLFGIT
jgi:hypothetical protein